MLKFFDFIEGVFVMFVALFWTLIFVPTVEVGLQVVDSVQEFIGVIKHPRSIIPDKITLTGFEPCDCDD